MKPSEALNRHREAICSAAKRRGVANPRVFGSTARGDDVDGSDLDLLVDPMKGTTLLDLGGLLEDLKQLLGIPVDVLTPDELPAGIRERVLEEAKPL